MSLGQAQEQGENFLQKSLVELEAAKDDAREYHKLKANEPKILQFVIEDIDRDVLVERKEGEEDKKPYSETTFVRVINLESQVQEPKPLRTSSKRLLTKLNEQFSAGNFTLKITRYGEKFDTDYKVVPVN